VFEQLQPSDTLLLGASAYEFESSHGYACSLSQINKLIVSNMYCRSIQTNCGATNLH
jgi:hypothetical protein